MKKIIFFSLLLIMSATLFSQQTNPLPVLSKQDFLQKSKSQKTIAWILLTGGSIMSLTGSIVWSNEVNKTIENDPFGVFYAPYTTTKGTGIVVAGILISASSIPLFIAAHRNKKKSMSVSFKKENVLQLQNSSLVNHSVPALSLKISL